jgi:hypothetical protein
MSPLSSFITMPTASLMIIMYTQLSSLIGSQAFSKISSSHYLLNLGKVKPNNVRSFSFLNHLATVTSDVDNVIHDEADGDDEKADDIIGRKLIHWRYE